MKLELTTEAVREAGNIPHVDDHYVAQAIREACESPTGMLERYRTSLLDAWDMFVFEVANRAVELAAEQRSVA